MIIILVCCRRGCQSARRPPASGMLLGPLFSPLNSDTSAVRKLLSASAFITWARNKGTLRMYELIQLRFESSAPCPPLLAGVVTHIRPEVKF